MERTKHGCEPQRVLTEQRMPDHTQAELPVCLTRMSIILGGEREAGAPLTAYEADCALTWVSA